MKVFLFFSVFLVGSVGIHAQNNQYTYHVNNKIVVNNINDQITRMAIIMPLAQTNQYQTVNNVKVYDGERVPIPGSDDVYIRWTLTELAQKPSAEIFYDFDVTLHAIHFDFSQITSLVPYDTTSENYTWYVGQSGAYVDPNNAEIRRIGSAIWWQSSDILDYARRCYEYVASNYKYINPFTGLHTLQEILDAGGGDCGNLSSVFISLLRYKKIPARHIVTVRPDGVYHVWSDFYLEKYGWVPVDVTFKNSDPKGDYFGKFDGNGIVMTKEVWVPLDKGNGQTYYSDILQGYNMWIWSNQGPSLQTSHKLTTIQFDQEESVLPGLTN